MKTARLLAFTLVAFATLVGPSRSDAEYEDGKWIGGDYICTIYQYTLTNSFGVVTQTWYTYEDCVPVDPATARGLPGRTPKDPFEGCDNSCSKPCKDFGDGCIGGCSNLVTCQDCCQSWKDTANKADGCKEACKNLNEAAWKVCVAACLEYKN